MFGVGFRLRGTQRNEVVSIDPCGQLRLDLGLPAAQHVRLDSIMQDIKVPARYGTPPLIKLIEIPIEAKEWTQHRRIEEIHQGMQFIDAILNGCAREHERI